MIFGSRLTAPSVSQRDSLSEASKGEISTERKCRKAKYESPGLMPFRMATKVVSIRRMYPRVGALASHQRVMPLGPKGFLQHLLLTVQSL